jgi:hypothetical protein
MRLTDSRTSHRLLYGVVLTLVLLSFALWDAGTVALSASVVTGGQLLAAVMAFGLIAIGVFVTAWRFSR